MHNGQRVFTHHRQFTPILRAWIGDGLITCPNWNDRFIGPYQPYAERRRYLPSHATLLQHWIGPQSATINDAVQLQPPPPPMPRVKTCRRSGVSMPRNLRALYAAGTGLDLHVGGAVAALKSIRDPGERLRKLRATIIAVGLTYGRDKIPMDAARWKQSESGRVTPSGPALFMLPSVVRTAALASKDGGEVWEVDYRCAEIRAMLQRIGADDLAAQEDPYAAMADELEVHRDIVKAALIPVMHGGRPRSGEAWGIVKLFRAGLGAEVCGEFDDALTEMDHRYDLQRDVAQVFMPAVANALDLIGADRSGLPIHDGLILAADGTIADTVADQFRSASEAATGIPWAVNVAQIGGLAVA